MTSLELVASLVFLSYSIAFVGGYKLVSVRGKVGSA